MESSRFAKPISGTQKTLKQKPPLEKKKKKLMTGEEYLDKSKTYS